MALLKRPNLVKNSSRYSKLYQILAANGYDDNEKLMKDVCMTVIITCSSTDIIICKLFQLAHPCDKLLEFCSWAGKQVDCLSIFSQSKAEYGLCCSFNSHL